MTPGSRERARALLVKALYQWQLAGHTREELLEQYAGLAEYGRVDQDYFSDLLGRVLAAADELDATIEHLADRGLGQLDAVGHGILLLALAELKFRDDVPVKVVINEAVKLAKRFGAHDSYRFVNAVVDRASKTLRPPPEATAG